MEKKNFPPPLPPEFDQSNCKQLGIAALDIMYPENGDRKAEAIARSVCTDCVVIEPCLDRGMKFREQGVWGATTETDRDTIRRKVLRNARRNNGN